MNTNSCPASSIRGEERKPGYSFRVTGISAEVLNEFRHLSDDELQERNVFRVGIETFALSSPPIFIDRIERDRREQ
jgi:hypothetical protein